MDKLKISPNKKFILIDQDCVNEPEYNNNQWQAIRIESIDMIHYAPSSGATTIYMNGGGPGALGGIERFYLDKKAINKLMMILGK